MVKVWPLELFHEVVTMESEASRQGVKFYDCRGRNTSFLNVWQEAIQVGNLHRTANVDDVLVCNPLLVLCSVMDCEHDVFFTNGGRCHTKHDQTGEEN